METYLSSKCFEEMGETMGKKVLIATVYNPDPVLLAATKLGPDRLILLLEGAGQGAKADPGFSWESN